jgi:hypothetical protein
VLSSQSFPASYLHTTFLFGQLNIYLYTYYCKSSFQVLTKFPTPFSGCEIPIKSSFRDRTRSGRFSRDQRRKSVLGSRPSIIDWPMGKLAWLKDRQMFGSKQAGAGPVDGES